MNHEIPIQNAIEKYGIAMTLVRPSASFINRTRKIPGSVNSKLLSRKMKRAAYCSFIVFVIAFI
jgi:hypothetical protein